MRRVIILGLMVVAGWGCGGKSGEVTGATVPAAGGAAETRTATSGERVTAGLRDRFLYEHNAQFNEGRTFRWVTPIPIHIVTGDPAVDSFFLAQFVAWEAALAGAGGRPLYSVRPVATTNPPRGIFLALVELPGSTIGYADPFSPLGQSRRGTSSELGERARRRIALRAAPRRLEVPETLTSGETVRCLMSLDPVIFDSVEVAASTIRHEIGHCLGFIGHVSNPRSLMHATSCCPLTITSDVSGMMRRLYRLAPGTPVTR